MVQLGIVGTWRHSKLADVAHSGAARVWISVTCFRAKEGNGEPSPWFSRITDPPKELTERDLQTIGSIGEYYQHGHMSVAREYARRLWEQVEDMVERSMGDVIADIIRRTVSENGDEEVLAYIGGPSRHRIKDRITALQLPRRCHVFFVTWEAPAVIAGLLDENALEEVRDHGDAIRRGPIPSELEFSPIRTWFVRPELASGGQTDGLLVLPVALEVICDGVGAFEGRVAVDKFMQAVYQSDSYVVVPAKSATPEENTVVAVPRVLHEAEAFAAHAISQVGGVMDERRSG